MSKRLRSFVSPEWPRCSSSLVLLAATSRRRRIRCPNPAACQSPTRGSCTILPITSLSASLSHSAGYPRVVDGDTLDFSGTRVRMFGIGEPFSGVGSCMSRGGGTAGGVSQSTTGSRALSGHHNAGEH